MGVKVKLTEAQERATLSRAEAAKVIHEIKDVRSDICGRLDRVRSSTSGIRANIWLAALATAGLIAATLAWSGDASFVRALSEHEGKSDGK